MLRISSIFAILTVKDIIYFRPDGMLHHNSSLTLMSRYWCKYLFEYFRVILEEPKAKLKLNSRSSLRPVKEQPVPFEIQTNLIFRFTAKARRWNSLLLIVVWIYFWIIKFSTIDVKEETFENSTTKT